MSIRRRDASLWPLADLEPETEDDEDLSLGAADAPGDDVPASSEAVIGDPFTRPVDPESAECRGIVQEVLELHGEQLGRAAQAELKASLVAAMNWAADRYDPKKGGLAVFARSVARRAWAHFYGPCWHAASPR